MSALISVFSERAGRKRARNAYIGDSHSLRLRYFSSFFKADAPTFPTSGVGSPTLQNVGVQQRTDGDKRIQNGEQDVRDDNRLVLMRDTIKHPEDIEESE